MKRFRTPAERRELRRKGDANLLRCIGDRVAHALRGEFETGLTSVTMSATTSNAPLIRISRPDGTAYHVTITRARK